MDPDLIKNRKYSGHAADIWATGVILFLLITGGAPFWGENEQQLVRRISNANWSLPEKLMHFSVKVKNLLKKIF